MARFFINAGIIPPPGAEDAATTAWVAAVVANGGSVSSPRRTVVNSLIAGLKADGVFTKLDRLWLLAGENQPSALTDLIVNALATAVNSPTFTTDTGYAGNGSTSYLNLAYNPSVNAINLSLNSAGLHSWSAISRGGNNTEAIGGRDGSGNQLEILPYVGSGGGSIDARINNTTDAVFPIPSCQGFVSAIRSASNVVGGYYNGTQPNAPGSDASVGVPNVVMYGLGLNLNGTFFSGTTDQIACLIISGVLTGTDVANLYSRLNTYMLAVGVADSDTNVNAWMGKVRGNGGTVSLARRDLVHNLVAGLKTDGVWSKLDRLWLFAAADQPSALVDLVATTVATNVSSTTFTTDRGFTGNGSTMYIDSNSNPTVIAGNYLQDNACQFGWNNNTSTDGGAFFGGLTGGVSYSSMVVYTGSNYAYAVNANSPVNGGTTSTGAAGLYLMNRTSSTVETLDLNGSQVETHSNTSLGQQNTTLKALWDGNLTHSTRQISCMGFGGGLTGTDRSNLYLRLRTYMTGVGVP